MATRSLSGPQARRRLITRRTSGWSARSARDWRAAPSCWSSRRSQSVHTARKESNFKEDFSFFSFIKHSNCDPSLSCDFRTLQQRLPDIKILYLKYLPWLLCQLNKDNTIQKSSLSPAKYKFNFAWIVNILIYFNYIFVYNCLNNKDFIYCNKLLFITIRRWFE